MFTIDVFNDTDLAEQLRWHGQMVPVDLDGAAEEGYTSVQRSDSAARSIGHFPTSAS